MISLEPLSRAMLYIALALMVGLPINLAAVVLPTCRRFGVGATPILESAKRGLIAACLALLASVTLLFVAQVMPLELELSGIEEWGEFIRLSLSGQMWIARLALGFVALMTLRLAVNPAAWLTTCALLGVAAQVTITRTSHTAAMDAGWLPVASDLAHLFAGALWGGGLAALLIAMPCALRNAPNTSTEMTRALIQRFSPLGIVGVALATATGIGLSSLHVADAEALRTSDYGRLILLKIILAAGAIALAAIHKFATWRRMRSLADVRRFAGTLLSEFMLVIGVFTTAAVLASTSPPHHMVTHQMADGSTHMMLMTDPDFQRTLQIAALAILAAGGIAFALEWRARLKIPGAR